MWKIIFTVITLVFTAEAFAVDPRTLRELDQRFRNDHGSEQRNDQQYFGAVGIEQASNYYYRVWNYTDEFQARRDAEKGCQNATGKRCISMFAMTGYGGNYQCISVYYNDDGHVAGSGFSVSAADRQGAAKCQREFGSGCRKLTTVCARQ
ncbi:MAG: DUF4189 domain-containing protein [Filomicrobium sp.]